MQSGPHTLGVGGAPPSFTARKPAASSLPAFELPPPQLPNPHENKYQPFSNYTSGQLGSGSGSLAGAAGLLTPPNTLPGDGLSPGTAAAAYAAIAQGSQQLPQQQSSGFGFSQNALWPPSGQGVQPLIPSPSQQHPQSAHRQWIPPTGMYSPSSLNSMARQSDFGLPMKSPQSGGSTSDAYTLPSFNSTMSMAPPMNLPAMQPPQMPLNTNMMNQQMSNQSMPPLHSHDQYSGVRLPPTPTYSSQSTSQSSPQPNTFSPSSAGASTPFRPPSNGQPQMHSAPGSLDMGQAIPTQQSPPQYQRPFGQFSLPSGNPPAHVNGPVMTNMHTPHNTNMALVGNMSANLMPPFSSGHAANLQAMYAAHGVHPGHGPPSDRPFKCDQCMQSFNRNHDLKRHKRIHLAVKPYPCDYCDKSFSRKDALKRHMLVKGCGKVRTNQDPNDDVDDGSSSAGSPPAISISEHAHSYHR